MIPEKREHNWLKVIFDSSMLIDLPELKIDLVTETERVLSTKFIPIVLTGTISEIRDVLKRASGGKRKKELTLVLQIAEKFNKLNYFPLDNEDMDEVVFRAAKKLKAVVACNDYELRKKLVKAGVPVLFVRGKSHMELDGFLDELGTHSTSPVI
jgi:rRNA-processing protein FCF1